MNNGTASILIVEDDPDVSASLVDVLSDQGYTIATAYNGKEALTYLRGAQTVPRVILLDVMMPVMDGYEFRELQRVDPHLSDIPVVLLTADARAGEKASAMAAAAFLRKPVQLDDLYAVVGRYCDQAS